MAVRTISLYDWCRVVHGSTPVRETVRGCLKALKGIDTFKCVRYGGIHAFEWRSVRWRNHIIWIFLSPKTPGFLEAERTVMRHARRFHID
jgi:hypothetical protein